MISATQPRENEETALTGLPQSVASTTVQPWSAPKPISCSFLAPRMWQLMDDCGGGQNTAIKGKWWLKRLKILQNI